MARRSAIITYTSVLLVLSLTTSVHAITYDERKAQIFHQKLALCGEAVPPEKGGGRDGRAGCFERLPAELYDGKAILTIIPVEYNAAWKAWRKYQAQHDSVSKQWNRSKYLRSHPDRKHFVSRLNEHGAYINEVLAALKALEATVMRTQATCKSWDSDVKTKPGLWAIKVLMGKASDSWISGAMKPDRKTTINPGHLERAVNGFKELRLELDKIAAACADPKNDGIGVKFCLGRQSMNRVIKMEAPATWCELSAKRDEHIAKILETTMSTRLANQKTPYKVDKNGSVWTSVPVYLAELELSEKTKSGLIDVFAALYESAGIPFKPAPDLFAAVEATYAEARARIDKSAPEWKRRDKGKTGRYGAKLAKKAVKKRYKKAKITKAYMTSTKWKISKNALGIPKNRKAWGVVLYGIKGERWCREGQFIIFEDYEGAGRYQKDDEAYIEVERFRPCK